VKSPEGCEVRIGVFARWALASALLASLACAAIPGGEPVRLESAPEPAAAGAFPNWPLPPERAEHVLEEGEILRAVDVESAGAGVTGAEKDLVMFRLDDEGEVEVKLKWKLVPGGLDGPNNSPRREIAAYEVQKLFLDPGDWVVPTSALRCPSLEVVREHHPGFQPNVKGTECGLGLASLWMKDVTVPDVHYDEERFRSDPTYAYFMSNFNLLTYLIAHKDGRKGNFLISEDPKHPQMFAIDNGVAFDIAYGGIWFNWFVPNFNRLRIPAVRKESVERLRKLRREDLDRLGVIAQTAPPGPNLEPDNGASRRGDTLQFGLKQSEIDDIWQRIEDLLAAVDAGRVSTF
jgi:hypothetical protein